MSSALKKPDLSNILQFPKKQGQALTFNKPEPWDDDVIGSDLAEEISATIRKYVVLSESSNVAVTLWIILTYCFEHFTVTPILAILSPEKQCGKTTLFDVLGCLVSKPLLAASITASSIFRIVDSSRPTLLIDEADTFIHKNEALRGVLNSGNRASGNVLRTMGETHEVRSFSTYSPKAIALIGNLPDTLQDRSVCVRLRRRTKDEKVSRFLSNRTEALEITARKIAHWVDNFGEELSTANPILPDYLSNRVADNWLPLLAVADLIGDSWGERARTVAKEISEQSIDDTVSYRTLLLEDIKSLFDKKDIDRLPSAAIVNMLNLKDESPWAEWNRGQSLTAYQLAKLLRAYSITSRTIRMSGSRTAKGYLREQFEEAWEHYLPKTNKCVEV